MHNDMRFRRPVLVAVATVLGACAYPKVQTAVRVGPQAPADSASAVPVIQVRSHNVAPTMSVVAWMDEASYYGLRSWIPRNGEPLPEGSRLLDHRLFISTTSIVEAGGVRRATLGDRELLIAGVARESRPCDGGFCLPVSTYGIRIPDAVLRSFTDTAVVRIVTPSNSELDVVLPRELISGYLRALDSVSASMKAKAAPRP